MRLHECVSMCVCVRFCSVLEEILYGFVGNHLLVKDVGARLWALHHLDNFCVGTAIVLASLQGGHGFLCHILLRFAVDYLISL